MSFMGTAFKTKRHDTAPFRDRLEREATPGAGDFAAIDLTGATVKFFASDPETGVLVIGAGVVTVLTPVVSTDPNVSYAKTAGEMALSAYTDEAFPLTLRAEWEITYASGIVETVPAGKDYLRVIVGRDLG